MKIFGRILLVAIPLLIIAAALWFQFPEWSYINSDIEKVYCSATLDDEFSDNEVMIVLTNDASLEYIEHEYTPADFPMIGCVEVSDLSTGATEKVKAQLRGDPKPTPTRPGEAWFYEDRDLTQFHRILCLKLDKESKLNVLFVVKLLEHRDDIRSAEPNYIIKAIG